MYTYIYIYVSACVYLYVSMQLALEGFERFGFWITRPKDQYKKFTMFGAEGYIQTMTELGHYLGFSCISSFSGTENP